jgi:DNA-binding XRE family transcriptional regulator
MNGGEFKAWRERMGLTQENVAQKFGVSRTTVQNWEGGGGLSPVSQTVEMGCQIWEARLKQENPNLGPVTLVYSDGPMFVNPYGPGSRPAMMDREPYPTNAAAIARVQLLWGREGFHNPLIIEEPGTPLWNVVELQRVVTGNDPSAPTLDRLLHLIAEKVRSNSHLFVQNGPKSFGPTEIRERQQAIEKQADELERLASGGLQAMIDNQLKIEDIFFRLQVFGTRAPDALVSNVAQALEALSTNCTRPAGDCTFLYRECEITWPRLRMFGNKWTVNVASNNPHVMMKLGGRTLVIDDYKSLMGAVQQAVSEVDNRLEHSNG